MGEQLAGICAEEPELRRRGRDGEEEGTKAVLPRQRGLGEARGTARVNVPEEQ